MLPKKGGSYLSAIYSTGGEVQKLTALKVEISREIALISFQKLRKTKKKNPQILKCNSFNIMFTHLHAQSIALFGDTLHRINATKHFVGPTLVFIALTEWLKASTLFNLDHLIN